MFPDLSGYGDNTEKRFIGYQIHLKIGGICSSCIVNTCT